MLAALGGQDLASALARARPDLHGLHGVHGESRVGGLPALGGGLGSTRHPGAGLVEGVIRAMRMSQGLPHTAWRSLLMGFDPGCPGEGLRGDLSRLLTGHSADGPIQAAWVKA